MRSLRATLAMTALVLARLLISQSVSADPLPNAWQIVDNSSSGGSTLSYTTNLTASQHQSATNSGFHFTVNARYSTDFGDTKTMTMVYGLGTRRFLIWWELNTNGDLTAELEGGNTYTLTANGTGSALYHTHEIIFSANGTAEYVVDGRSIAKQWQGSDTDYTAGQVSWGAGASGGQGEMNFHTVTFEINSVGVVAAYDAGTAGSPPTAPNPATQSWTQNPTVPVSGTIGRPVAADSIGALPNAWQITDNDGSGGLLSYTTNLTSGQRIAATNITGGFHYTINARFVTNFADTKSLNMAYGLGSTRFLIWWNLTNGNNLIADLDGQGVFILTTNGTGTTLYHTHEIIYNPTNKLASYVVDGQVLKTNWTAGASDLTAGQVSWGAGSSPGQGQVNFHSVQFEINGLGTVASYDAGMIGNPVIATNPVTQGWTSTPSAPPASATNAISPDMSLLPTAVTSDADQFVPGGAQINGTADPSGSPTMGWFEWGTSLVYGNVTTPQSVGSGIAALSFSNSINGIVAGPVYYFRAVVSNAFGVVKGGGQSFSLASFLPLATTLAPNQFTTNSARLNGQVNPNGLPTGAWFEWGTNTSYGNVTLAQDAGQGSITTNLNAVLSGLISETDYHYRLVASNAFGLALGADQSFSLSFLQTPILGLPEVAYSSVAWGDYDNDGRLDFLLTGSSSTGLVSQVWRNTGGGFSNVSASVASGLPGVSFGSVAWGDFDNDGRLDFLLTGNSSTGLVSQVWRNTGGGFSNVSASVAPGLPGVYCSSVAWGDFDNDGRLDFLLTGSSSTGLVSQVWRNTGGGFSNETVNLAPGLPQTGVAGGSVAWGDYDNDGWQDFLITGVLPAFPATSRLWRNTGSGFTSVTSFGPQGVYYSSVAWGDYDNDGRLDFLITGTTNGGASGTVSQQLWRNNVPLTNAAPTAPAELAATVSGTTVSLSWNPPADDLTPSTGLNYNLRLGTTPGASDVLAPMALANGQRLLPVLGKGQTTSAQFTLLPNHTYYWSVQALDTSFAGSPFAAEQQFTFPPQLINPVRFSSGIFEFYFTNQTAFNFDILVSTNVTLPVSNWFNLGPAIPLGGGLYRFTDADAIGQSKRFYLLRQQ